jgi:hypothetical protein
LRFAWKAEPTPPWTVRSRHETGAHIDHYHNRPHSRLGYRTVKEVRQTWDDAQAQLQKAAA